VNVYKGSEGPRLRRRQAIAGEASSPVLRFLRKFPHGNGAEAGKRAGNDPGAQAELRR